MLMPISMSRRRCGRARHGRGTGTAGCGVVLGALAALAVVTIHPERAMADAAPAGGDPGDDVVIVGGDANFAPHQFVEDGEATGFDIDVARAALEASGTGARFELGPWAAVMERLATGEIDVMAGMSRSPARRKRFDFSVPYAHLTFVAFVANTSPFRRLEQLEGRRVLVQESGVAHEALRRRFERLRIAPAATVGDALQRLAAGDAAAAVVPRLQGLYWMKQQGAAGLRTLDEPVTSRPYGFAVQAGNYRLLHRLEEGLAIIREGEQLQAIRDKWLAPLQPQPWWQRARSYLLAAGAMAVLLTAIAVWNGLLRRRVAQRTAALADSESRLAGALTTRQALINSLPAHIALIDGDGTIIDANERWRRFGMDNANPDPDFGIGANYLEVCERASGDCAEGAREAAEGVRAVLSGERQSFAMEYPCHSPETSRWFRVMVNRLVEPQRCEPSPGAVVMHVDITERKLAEQALDRLAYEDPLTGLPSHNGFVERVAESIESAGWQPGAIIASLNVRGLHDVNEAHGFSTGDQLLVQVGQRLSDRAGPHGVAGRTGGDDFIVFLPNRDHATDDERMEELGAIFERPFELGRVRVEVQARFGYTRLGKTRRDLDEVVRDSSLALSHTRFHFAGQSRAEYTQELKKQAQHRIRISHDLHRALEREEFELHFQPKVSLSTGEVFSCEALLRWRHPELGLQPPDQFIPVAEQSQLIGPLGIWVVNEACRMLRQWKNANMPTLSVAVNVSLVQLLVGDFVSAVRDALTTHNVPPSALSLEITESVFEQHSGRLLRQLNALHAMGVRLSLDDFGTGYSSLLYLQRYPFDEIKIDRGFVSNIVNDRYSQSIVNTVLGVACAIGAQVVAEGVEDEAMRDKLLELGCELGQGFFYSAPLANEDFRWLLEKQSVLPRRVTRH